MSQDIIPSSNNNGLSDDDDDNHNHNDIAASRCEGLMSMIKMNLSKGLIELGHGKNDEYVRRMAHVRLGEFIQTFNFSAPMVKLDSKMWLALSVLLLHLLLPKEIRCDDDDKEREEGLHESRNNVPVSIAAIGICFEEYTYLTKSAIPTLSRGLIVDS